MRSVSLLLPRHTLSACTSGRNQEKPCNLFRIHRNPSTHCTLKSPIQPKHSHPSMCRREKMLPEGLHTSATPFLTISPTLLLPAGTGGNANGPSNSTSLWPPNKVVLTPSHTQSCMHSAPKSCPARPPCNSDQPQHSSQPEHTKAAFSVTSPGSLFKYIYMRCYLGTGDALDSDVSMVTCSWWELGVIELWGITVHRLSPSPHPHSPSAFPTKCQGKATPSSPLVQQKGGGEARLSPRTHYGHNFASSADD